MSVQNQEGGPLDLIEIDEDSGSSDDEDDKTANVMHLKAKPTQPRLSQ